MSPLKKHLYYTRHVDRPRLILVMLIVIILLLGVLRLSLKQSLDVNDASYARVLETDKTLRNENTILRAKLDEARALSTIAKKATGRGMVPGTLRLEKGRVVLLAP